MVLPEGLRGLRFTYFLAGKLLLWRRDTVVIEEATDWCSAVSCCPLGPLSSGTVLGRFVNSCLVIYFKWSPSILWNILPIEQWNWIFFIVPISTSSSAAFISLLCLYTIRDLCSHSRDQSWAFSRFSPLFCRLHVWSILLMIGCRWYCSFVGENISASSASRDRFYFLFTDESIVIIQRRYRSLRSLFFIPFKIIRFAG